MPLDKPVLQFQYASDASANQPVCSLDGTYGLQALCLDPFPGDAATFAVWIKTASTAANAVLYKYASPQSSGQSTLTISNPANVSLAWGSQNAIPSGVALNDNLWHQLLITIARTSVQSYAVAVYLEGIALYRSQGWISTLGIATGGDLYVGWDGTAASEIVALASELQVWNRVLTAEEITTGVFRRAVDGSAGLALHWPLNAAPAGNPNAKIVSSALRFRTGAARASWTAVTDASSYELQAGSSDGLWNVDTAGITGTDATLPAPLRSSLTAQARAFQGATAGPWSDPISISAFEMGQTTVAMNWTEATGILLAAWPDVPRRSSFTLELFQGASTQPTVTSSYTTLNFDLTSKLDDPSSWMLAVRAFAAGSLGPAQPAMAADAPADFRVTYRSASQTLSASWTAGAGAEFYRFRIAPQAGGIAYGTTLTGSTTAVTVTNAQYPLTDGATYTVEVRALGQGEIGNWSLYTLNVHQVAAPVLDWTYTAGADALNAVWSEVVAGDTYNLNLYKGTDTQPVVSQTGLTTRSFLMTPYAGQVDYYRVLVSAVDAGVEGPTNQPAAPNPLHPTLQYIVDSKTLLASWAQNQPDAYLRIFKQGTENPTGAGRFLATSTSFPAPETEYPEGTVVTLNAQGLAPGYLAGIETATATVHLLAKPAPVLSYSSATAKLSLNWQAINPPLTVAYQMQQVIGGVAQPVVDVGAPPIDLTSLLGQDGTAAANIRGAADNSIGPWSDPAVTAPITGLALSLDEGASAVLTISWAAVTGMDAIYVELWKQGATTPQNAQWLAGTATSTTVDVSSDLGQTVTVKARAVKGNAMSANTTMSMAVTQVIGPTLAAPTDIVQNSQILTSWTFNTASTPGVIGYTDELSSGGSVLQTVPVNGAATQSNTFTGSFTVGKTYAVRVRARVQPAPSQTILGAWSQTQTITYGVGDLAIATMNVTSDDAGNVQVSWSVAQTFQGETFDAEIPALSYSRTGLTGTTVTLAASDTHVVLGTTYTVQLRATVGNSHGAWAQRSVKAGQPPPPPPPPDRGGDPVIIRSGAFVYTNDDLVMPAVVALRFTCFYRSDSPLPDDQPALPSTPMGARWNHVYNTRIQKSPDEKTVALIWGDLTIVIYDVPPSVTGYYSQEGIPTGATLFVDSSLNYTLTTRDQTVYFFNPQGALLTITSPAGNRTSLSYSGSQLQRVADDGSGRFLSFTYDGNGRVHTVTPSSGAAISYDFDSSGNLTQCTDPLNGTRQFSYDGASRILTVTDALHQVYVKNTYDSQGRVTFQQDARAVAGGLSYGTGFAYATQGTNLIVTITDRMGEVTTYTFDSKSGMLMRKELALGSNQVQRTSYTYDPNANILTRTLFEGTAAATGGNTWTYTYDGNSNQTSVTDPLGFTQTFVYNRKNQLISSTDQMNNLTRYTYAGNLLQSIQGPLGTTTITYQPGNIPGLVATVTDMYGAAIQFTYSPQGQAQQIADAGGVSLFQYNGAGWPTVNQRAASASGPAVYAATNTPNAMGWVTRIEELYQGQPQNQPFVTVPAYNANGLLTSLLDALNATTQYQYDPDGALAQITYPATGGTANTTINTYDREERLIATDYGAGVVQRSTYDAAGRLATATDPNGNVTRYAYSMEAATTGNSLNGVVVTTLPVNVPGTQTPETTRLVRDAAGRLISSVDTAGNVTTRAYSIVPVGSANGMLIVTTLPKTNPQQPQAYTTQVKLDAMGRTLETIDEAGRATTYVYAAASSVPNPGAAALAVTITRPAGNVELSLYDGLGRLVEIRRNPGANQRVTQVLYDPLDRVTSVTESSLTTTSVYSYVSGLLQTEVNTGGKGGPTFQNNALGALVNAMDQAGKTVAYTYTPSGQMATYTNSRNQQLVYGYDAAGRLTSTTLPGTADAIAHTLDANGNRTATSLAGAVKVRRTFDALNRLLTREDSQQRTVTYTYNALGRIATLTYPVTPGVNPVQVTYGYDGLGRLQQAQDWANRTTTYTYYPAGELESAAQPNGVNVAYTIDANGRLTSLTNRVGPLIVSSSAYTYDVFDEVVTQQDVLPAPFTATAGAKSLTYVGTRLTDAGGTSISYDDDGDMTSLPGVAGALAYDVFQEVTGAGAQTFDFDVDGLRTGATANGATRGFVYDIREYVNPWREQAAYPLAGAARTRLRPGANGQLPMLGGGTVVPAASALDRLIIETSAGADTRFVHGVQLIGAELPSGEFQNYLFDGQGSTSAIAGGNGGLANRHVYGIYGDAAGGDPVSQPFGYVGQYGVMTDQPGLYYMRTRSYAPGLMRFTGQDYLLGRAIQPQTLNRYPYGGNNPILRVDPLGEDHSWIWGLFGGIAAGVAAYFLPEILGGIGTFGGLGVGLSSLGNLFGRHGVSSGSWLRAAGRGVASAGRWLRWARPYSWRPYPRNFGYNQLPRGGGGGAVEMNTYRPGSGWSSSDVLLESENVSLIEMSEFPGEAETASNTGTQVYDIYSNIGGGTL